METQRNYPENLGPSLGTETSEQKNIESWTEEVKNAEPEPKWTVEIPEKQYGLVIRLPHECFVSATLNVAGDQSRSIYIDYFQVNEKLKGQGIGTRLLQALREEARKFGVTTIGGHITSKAALAVRAKVFGKENITMYNHATGEPVNKTYEEILQDRNELNPDTISYNVIAKLA